MLLYCEDFASIVIKRKLHGRGEINNISSHVENISTLEEKFRISAQQCYFFLLCKILAIQQRSNKYSISSDVCLGLTSPQRQFAAAAKAEMWRSKLAKTRRVFYLISRERKLGIKLFWIYDVKCFFLAFKFINKLIISIGIILTEWEEFS